jgi:predicted ArsR family transcriptional regulator
MYKQTEMYPFAAGFKEIAGASEQAAKKQNKEQNNERRRRALNLFKNHPNGLTSDEVANILGENILAIRPRVSELRAQGKIESTGTRRKSVNGNGATVWKINYAG